MLGFEPGALRAVRLREVRCGAFEESDRLHAGVPPEQQPGECERDLRPD